MGRSGGGDNGIVFAIKTNLCTSKQLESGDHTFPFQCQMPMVNFPSSMQHPMIASSYLLTASLNDSCKSDPLQIYFEPFIETSPRPKVSVTTYNNNISLLTGMYYQLHTDTIIRVQVPSTEGPFFVYLKRFLTVGKHHVESMVVSSAQGTGVLVLAIPDSIDLPSVSHSSRYQVEYKVCVYGTKVLLLKRKLFDIPVTLGTLPHGTRAPDDLLSYADDGVFADMTARGKPMLRSSTGQEEDDLPPYDSTLPPRYPLAT
ncbi:hypothetical protein BJV82DRAFT_616889 [Fennellomyces sp. T-0311]|nr:hypothetical protein BJV82DRAFT_616889 [Fennellomyces sp. T-0311]